MDTLISMFIDNELDLDEKILFTKKTSADRSFSNETIALLQQEKLIRSEVVAKLPSFAFKYRPSRKQSILNRLRPLGLFASGIGMAIILFFLLQAPVEKSCPISSRFVIYRPDAHHVEIAGSFTGWEKIPMKRDGTSGYWEITLTIPAGEHRFTYLLDGQKKFLDPTLTSREKDDFGGQNSILYVEGRV